METRLYRCDGCGRDIKQPKWLRLEGLYYGSSNIEDSAIVLAVEDFVDLCSPACFQYVVDKLLQTQSAIGTGG